MNPAFAIPAGLFLAFAAPGCSPDDIDPLSNPAEFVPGRDYAPWIGPGELSPTITNQLFPAPVGARWVYEAETVEGLERTVVSVEEETRDVAGAGARVVRDTVTIDGELDEDSWDWYAEDEAGNVWYLGEETYSYEGGEVVCSCGAWETGIDGALPGVIMLADPRPRDRYREEFFPGEVEDIAEVVSVAETVDVPAGSFSECVKVRIRSVVDPSIEELDTYCPGVGRVLVEEGSAREELVESSLL